MDIVGLGGDNLSGRNSMVESLPYMQAVVGSIPTARTRRSENGEARAVSVWSCPKGAQAAMVPREVV